MGDGAGVAPPPRMRRTVQEGTGNLGNDSITGHLEVVALSI